MSEENNFIHCMKCGTKLPADSEFCIKCGEKINSVEGTVIDEKSAINKKNVFKKNKKIVSIICIAILGIAIIFFIVNSIGGANLKKELMKDWQTIEGEDGSYILCILDFSEDEIEYKLETGYVWMDTTVATYDYKVISGNKIKVKRYGDNYETFSINFNDDKTMMTVKPALTSVDDEEQWFNLD